MMRPRLALCLLVLPSIAMAEEDPLAAPGFVTVDRLDGTGHAGAEVSTDLDRRAWRFDAHAQVYVPHSPWSFFTQVPLRHDPDVRYTDATELGDIEAGVSYAVRVGPHAGYVWRVGLVLPTLPMNRPPDPMDGLDDSRSDVDIDDALHDGRPADLATSIGEAGGVRIAWSPMVRYGRFYGRVDFGVDIVGDGDAGLTIGRVQPAVGVQLGSFALSAELSAVKTSHFGLMQGSLGARQRLGPIELYGAIGTPFVHRDDGATVVTAGLDVPLP